MISRLSALVALSCLGVVVSGQALAQTSLSSFTTALKPVGEFTLPADLNGNFDHLTLDLKRQRLFVTPEDAKCVLVFDLATKKIVTRIPVARPHAVLYRADTDKLYVTDGEDGSIRVFTGDVYRPIKRIALEKDADAIGFDPSRKLLYVENGGGDAGKTYSMLTAIDTVHDEKANELRIEGETLESMALDAYRSRLYINNKATNQVVVVDRYRNTIAARWPLQNCKTNVAIALDEFRQRLFIGCRSGQIEVLDSNTGRSVATLPIHAGVDDLIFEPVSRRLYASTDGFVDAFDQAGLNQYTALSSIATAHNARTEFYSPELNRLFVSAPKQGTVAAHILVFEPIKTQSPHPLPVDVKEPVDAPAAQKIVLEELSNHPLLRRMGIHVIPPGRKSMILIANGNQTRLGIHTSESDFEAVKQGTIYGPRNTDGEFYNMKMYLFDANHKNIGVLVMEIASTDATSEQDAAEKAALIREEVARQIPDLNALFSASSH